MKSFFNKYSYIMVKMFIHQCVIGLFGNILALFSASVKSVPVTIAVGVFGILFYFFLIYMLIWDVGSRDSNSIDAGRSEYLPFAGLFIAIGAAIPNLFLALLHALCFPFAASNEFLSGVCAISRIVMLFINGMYTGLMSTIKIGGMAINNFWWTYFIIALPIMAVSTLAYILGTKNMHFTKILLPVTPEEQEIKREKKIKK